MACLIYFGNFNYHGSEYCIIWQTVILKIKLGVGTKAEIICIPLPLEHVVEGIVFTILGTQDKCNICITTFHFPTFLKVLIYHALQKGWTRLAVWWLPMAWRLMVRPRGHRILTVQNVYWKHKHISSSSLLWLNSFKKLSSSLIERFHKETPTTMTTKKCQKALVVNATFPVFSSIFD